MRRWLSVAAVVVIVGLLWVLWPKFVNTHTPPTMHTVSIGALQFKVEIADNEASRELGLGQRASLPEGQGMLFVFEHAGNWGFWMKDTEFPLDMLWARADGTITTIVRDVATSTYPQIFTPDTPDALYVLEVNAGAAKDIRPGDKFVLQ